MPFEKDNFVFTLDRTGLKLEQGEAVEFELDYAELELEPEQAPSQFGSVLSRLLGEPIADEEGLFDLAVHREGQLVATLALSCEEDALEVLGERRGDVSEASLAEALLGALPP